MWQFAIQRDIFLGFANHIKAFASGNDWRTAPFESRGHLGDHASERRLASILSIRLPSMSMISKDHMSCWNVSPTTGKCFSL